ncbi:MAG: hypothetical protein H6742_12945 [Alphaproteobacteria bacterium]|nr:hypothetical protein [Alphaproteobacteria bacterium]
MAAPPPALLLPLAALLLAQAPAWAQDEGAATADAAASPPEAEPAGPRWSAELRAEYVQGEQVIIPISVRNPGTDTLAVPDVGERPWLVRFDMILPDGRTISRYNTPPEWDPSTTWRLSPRGSRRALLEVPGGFGDFPRFELVVRLVEGDRSTEIARQAVRRTAPVVAAVDLGPDRSTGARGGPVAAWVHRSAEGAELMLHSAVGADPRGPTTIRHLAHLDGPVTPLLAAQAPADASSATVVWATGSRGLHVLRVEGVGGAATDVQVDAPWPAAEPIGRPAAVAGGTLVPLWVPAPKGDGGELRLVSIDHRGKPGFPRVDRYDHRPLDVRALVDSSGAAHFLVRHDEGVDLYTVRPDTPFGADALPPPGLRIWKPAPGLTLHGAQFGSLPRTDDDPGGLAVLLMVEQPGGLVGRWRDLQGRRITDVPPVAVPDGAALVGVAPDGATSLGLLFVAAGKGLWLEGRTTRVELGALPDRAQAVRLPDGTPALRVPGTREPVAIIPVSLPAPVPATTP